MKLNKPNQNNVEGISRAALKIDRTKFAEIVLDADNNGKPEKEKEKLEVKRGWMPHKSLSNGIINVKMAYNVHLKVNTTELRLSTPDEIVDTVIRHTYTSNRQGKCVFDVREENDRETLTALVLPRYHITNGQLIKQYRFIIEMNGDDGDGDGDDTCYWFCLKPYHGVVEIESQNLVKVFCHNRSHPVGIPCDSFILIAANILNSIHDRDFTRIPVQIGHGSHFEPNCL